MGWKNTHGCGCDCENRNTHVLLRTRKLYDISNKIKYKEGLDEIIRATEVSVLTGMRQPMTSARLHSSKPDSELLTYAEKWTDFLDQAFPCLYRASSEQSEIEEFYKQDLAQKLATHERERDDTLASHGDEGLIDSRYIVKVLTDKVNYCQAKEKRFFDEVQNLVSQFSRG